MGVQVNLLKPGQFITPNKPITKQKIQYWKFARECDDVFGGLMPNTARLKVVEVNTQTPGNYWIKVELPGRTPPGYLKISGEELSGNFDPAR